MTSTPERFRLDGKVALVTAAGGGFGSAICRGLAEQGADVVATDISEKAVATVADQVRSRGRRASAFVTDVSDPAQIEQAVQRTVTDFGRLDLLVNVACAAVLKPILEMTLEDFEKTMSSCLRGAFLTSQAAGRFMVQREIRGAIIHISSIASERALGRGTGIYAASKAGVNAMVRELAVELAPHGIRVNAIAPCQFMTTGLRNLLENPKFGGRDALTSKMLGRIPLARFGDPEEIVGPCVFLASEAASMVTGHVLFVDGGYMAQ